MWPGIGAKTGVMLMARNKEANNTLPSTQLICEALKASSNVRTLCDQTTLLDRLE